MTRHGLVERVDVLRGSIICGLALVNSAEVTMLCAASCRVPAVCERFGNVQQLGRVGGPVEQALVQPTMGCAQIGTSHGARLVGVRRFDMSAT